MRNKKGQFIHNKLKNWRIWVLSFTVLACLTASHYSNIDDTYVAEVSSEEAFMIPVVVTPPPTIEDKIKQHFPRSWPNFIQIAHAESKMNPNAIGYNCWYNSKSIYNQEGKLEHATGTVVYASKVEDSFSTSCKPPHRKYAWSLDCGLMQLNTKAKQCPKEDLDTHLARAAELSKKQGECGWFGYKNYYKECTK